MNKKTAINKTPFQNKINKYKQFIKLFKKKKFMLPRIALKLLKKKLGFRTLLNVIPLDAQLVKGSHGAVDIDEKYYPILIDPSKKSENEQANKFIEPTSVFDIIKNHIFQ